MAEKKAERVIERFDPAIDCGLTSAQVEARRGEDLLNNLKQKSGKSYLSIFLGNIFTYFNILCFIVAGALIAVGAFTDVFFLVIISANIIIGIGQEIKAKLMIGKLKILSQGEARVVRDGETKSVPLAEIALDDIMILTTGNQVSSDCIIKEGTVDVNESMLTGESVAVRKKEGDLLYGGSFIALGTCYARVEHVKEDNYIQKLTAKAKQYKKPKSEILRTLSVIIRVIGVIIIPIAILMFFHNKALSETFAEAVRGTAGSVIGMIPAGLFLLTSTTLVVGIIKLARKHCLVQDMYCIEMLARVNVLCLDKTGTITDGKMIVQDYVPLGLEREDAAEVISSMQAALQDNNFTSIALVSYFGQEGKRKAEEILPFTSANKYSAVRFSDATYLLGAPEFVMKERSEELETLIHGYSSQGLRVLLLGRTAGGIAEDKVIGEVEAMGLVTLSDNIRDDTIETIQWFKDNDVSIRVISGDNPLTVSEVARRAGIDGAEKWISLEGMSPEQVVAVANSYTVFGRVTPDQKAVLVRAIKAAGNTVAMTGDGVNDILALKDADCAIAMAAGADAAKNVSHLVLMDSKFSSMPRVVEEGRKVINNIQRSSSLFLMKTVFTVLLSIGIICTPGVAYPFSPKNLVLMEVCVIGFPSFVLALEPNRERIKGHFLTQTFSKAIPNGLILLASVIAMLVYNSFIEVSPEELEAMCVLALSFVSFWLLIDLCIPINWIRAAMLAAMAGVCVFIIGVMPGFIGLVPLNVDEMLVISVVVLACYPAGQILNYISRFVFKTIDEHRHARRKEGKSE